MNERVLFELWRKQSGLITAESYSTAWMSVVPSLIQPTRPAWPDALALIRAMQLPDGGWGDHSVYYAHDRMISTLAAVMALKIWADPQDEQRIAEGLQAISLYACDLKYEQVEPIGFELLLPSLATELELLSLPFPHEAWAQVSESTKVKLGLVGKLDVDPLKPRTWWFSMELLPTERLARLDEQVLDRYGAIATSSAATAAFLRAHRLQGREVRSAAAYLERVFQATGGGGNVTWPIDVFELAWTLDNLRRSGIKPTHAGIAPMIWRLATYWELPPLGVTWNQAFRVRDGDHPAVAYRVLRWAGLHPSDQPIMDFWHEESGSYMTYLDERGTSISTTIHGLTAFRENPYNRTHRHIAIQLTDWLRERVKGRAGFHDKWHLSPLYPASRLLPTLIGWDDDLARFTMEFILSQQREDGGWGLTVNSNQEETALAVLALAEAYGGGLLKDLMPLRRAQSFLNRHVNEMPQERLWIGKSLYLPIGVVKGVICAAQLALSRHLPEQASYPTWAIGRTLRTHDALATD
jgi:hypothetical protein